MARITVTLPLGIGDCHWVLMRMRAFRNYIGPGHEIHAHIAHGPNHRSSEFLQLTRFFDKVVVDQNALIGVPEDHQNPKWSTLHGSEGWKGYDFCLQANGHLERGDPIETWLPELDEHGGIDYFYDIDLRGDGSLDDVQFTPRILLYPSGTGPNRGFRTGWGRPQWDILLKTLNHHGHRPTFVGANTQDDLSYWQDLRLKGDFEDLVGKTSLREYLALIMCCRVWYGLNSGGGIMSAAFRRHTIMLWSDQAYGGLLHPKMQRNWVGVAPNYYTFSYGAPGMEQESVDKLVEVCNATR